MLHLQRYRKSCCNFKFSESVISEPKLYKIIINSPLSQNNYVFVNERE